MRIPHKFIYFLSLVLLPLSQTFSQDKPQIVEHVFLLNGKLTHKASIGDVTIELKFDRSMNTDIDPDIDYSLTTADFNLSLPARGAWESDTLWQGEFTISSNLPSSGDGVYFFRISGATSAEDVVMDTTISETTLEICRPEVVFDKMEIDLGRFVAGNVTPVPLRISNPGCDSLIIESMTIPAPFTLSKIVHNQAIQSNSSIIINIGIDTKLRSYFEGQVTITIPQLRPSIYTIPVTGTSHGAKISITPDTLRFGNVELGGDSTQLIHIENIPAEDPALSDTLYIFSESSTDPTVFSVNSVQRSIAPGGSTTVAVKFKPTKVLNYLGNYIRLQNSDATQKDAKVVVLGRGIDNDPPPQIPGLSINWSGVYPGYTNADSIRICWQPITDSGGSGIAEIRWKLDTLNVAPDKVDDLGIGGGIRKITDSTTCVYLPFRYRSNPGQRLPDGRYYGYFWFVDGAGNSGFFDPVFKTITYDVTVPGVPDSIDRSIAPTSWFGRTNPFKLTFWLPKTKRTGHNDVSVVRWKYGTRPGSVADFDVSRDLGVHADTVTVQIPFNTIECGKGNLYVWLVDSTGNSSISNLAGIPYQFDGCSPHITRLRPHGNLIGTVGVAYQDTVLITDETDISEATVYYRFGGAQAEEPPAQAHRIDDSDLFVVTIPQGAMTRRGLEYRVVAADQFGQIAYGPTETLDCSIDNEETWFPVRTRIAEPDDRPIDNSGNPVPLKSGEELTNYQMFSVPYSLDNPKIAAVLGDDLGEYNDTQWRFFDYISGHEGSPWVEGYSARDFIPGRSYFIITRKENIVPGAGPGTTVRTICPDTIALNVGWNFIASPFAFPVHKSSLNLINSNSILTLRSYAAGWDITDVLQPWQGYALYVTAENTNAPIYLVFQPMATESHAQKTAALVTRYNEGEWALKIAATAGNYTDQHNWAGLLGNASNTVDAFDMAEPPAIGNYVSVSFPHSEWQQPAESFCADMRDMQEPNQIWTLAIQSNIPGQSIELNFDRTGNFDNSKNLYLVDEDAGLKLNLGEYQQYTLPAQNARTPKLLKIISGTMEFVAENTANVADVPNEFHLAQNYPNPFNPETHIRFSMPQNEHVHIVVFDQLGRLVRTLVQGEMAAGYHDLTWDGMNEAGQRMASGLYFLQMRSGSFLQTRKMVILK
ncbi:MAG: choice-of-anchor D domain-containing protein [Deferribacteres bacterium]|nr:choice-of-anchor D domain-containing protein [candidate division KSB1 bacterium]MCB9500804.1 choice-of-anchor D domain-containing protein [Deferribacteres bacterium]